MRPSNKFAPGDRVAFSAKFCKSISAFTGRTPHIKGTYAADYSGTHGYVHWDDEGARIARKEGNFGEPDYCDHVRAQGELMALANICRVGSARYACNDL